MKILIEMFFSFKKAELEGRSKIFKGSLQTGYQEVLQRSYNPRWGVDKEAITLDGEWTKKL